MSFIAAGAFTIGVPGLAVITDFLADAIIVEFVSGRAVSAVAGAVVDVAVFCFPVSN